MKEETKSSDAEIRQLIAEQRYPEVVSALASWADPEIADLLVHLERGKGILLYRTLPRQQAAKVFSYLEPEAQDEFLKALTDTDTRTLLANMSPDDRTALLQELPAQVTRRLMQLLGPEDLAESRQLLGYPEESVGRLMTPDYIRLRAEWTVGIALEHIRKYGRDSEIFNILYVTDAKGKLVDIVRMRRLIMAPLETVIGDMLNYNCISISAFADREDAVEMIQRYDVSALPVVDSDGVIVGIVTVDDIMDVAEEETTEDIQKSVAMAPLETKYSLATPLLLFRKRILWLIVLILVNLISAAVISNYEDYVLEFITLALFMPLVIASGGNCGAQSSTLMVRAIATGDLELKDWFQATGKEVLVGLLLGAAMALIAGLMSQLYGGDTRIAMIVGLSMTLIVFTANIFGAILPFILSRLKIDPATASTPLITSLMDVLGLIIYFGVAVLVLT
ncbi:MAG: Magnesium transporter MgtE [Opitutia bacterium UBA7350]|nr:MAG: Magnesium transporter MgtE [Opitutae bacterium UBA7350]